MKLDKLKIVLASQNRNKAREIQEMLNGSYNVVSMEEMGIHNDLIENGTTIEENSELKAQQLRHLLGDKNTIIMADDTGLFVDALDGAPGVYSARYAGEDVTFEQNNEKMLEEMKTVAPENRTAEFRTCLTLLFPGDYLVTVTGSVPGSIAENYRGQAGFGYDPLFIEKSSGKTYAEMNEQEKNRLSHRRAAVDRAIPLLDQYEMRRSTQHNAGKR
ncbi:MAG: RdgB/HAM1 family non-canonical purine NTP pyrophosphatase [Eubacteriaceae bacterium]|jgi:XTP/dITP diphosphohydrolase